MRLLINEVLDNIDKLDTVKDKILTLKNSLVQYPEIKKLLAINFNHNSEGFNGLPVGVPVEYHPDVHTPIGYSDFVMAGIWRKLYIYSDVNLNPSRKLQLYLQVLEGLHYLEYELLNFAKDGNLWHRYPWISDECAKEIFGIGKEEETKTEEVIVPLIVDNEVVTDPFLVMKDDGDKVVDTTVTVKRGRGRPPKVK